MERVHLLIIRVLLKIKLNVLITILCTGFLFFGCSNKSNNQLFKKPEKTDKRDITKKIKKSFKLVINTPEDVKIEILDEKLRPQKKILLKQGKYKIKITKRGYETYIETINLNKNIEFTIDDSKLKKDINYINLDKITQYNVNYKGNINWHHENSFSSNYLEVFFNKENLILARDVTPSEKAVYLKYTRSNYKNLIYTYANLLTKKILEKQDDNKFKLEYKNKFKLFLNQSYEENIYQQSFEKALNIVFGKAYFKDVTYNIFNKTMSGIVFSSSVPIFSESFSLIVPLVKVKQYTNGLLDGKLVPIVKLNEDLKVTEVIIL